jgi:signal transduction histidine kinase
MNLSCFITTEMESILKEWSAFARSLGAITSDMSEVALRDHAELMLRVAAKDIATAQSAGQQSAKSKGHAEDELLSAASDHGKDRQEAGFTMPQMISEYRALRATVLRLWLAQVENVTEETTNDMLRFNEAIDQAVAESTARFAEQTKRTRDTFLAILGHDLRTPLAAISMAAEYLTMAEVSSPQTVKVAGRVKRSAAAMNAMVNDLLEYARTQMGSGMPIVRGETDVQVICAAAVDEVRTAHPDCDFELDTTGALSGYFDSARLRQALINLMSNAVQYRAKEHPVKISAHGEPDVVTIQVQNQGPVIPKESLEAIFSPLVQLAPDGLQNGRPSTSLGLGLFIAREITEAHEGTIAAESSEGCGTVFTVKLPKAPAEEPTHT